MYARRSSRSLLAALACFTFTVAACSSTSLLDAPEAGPDGSGQDAGAPDAVPTDAGPTDGTLVNESSTADAPLGDAVPTDATGDVSAHDGASTDAPPTPLGGPGLLVLFGGFHDDTEPRFDDTWTFDGATWTQVPVASAPPGRDSASMASLGDRVVLFGGVDLHGAPLGDTWTFDGTTWTQVTASPSPPARSSAGMATLGAEVVLFGGVGPVGVSGRAPELGDTWTFDGATWTQWSGAGAPQARFNPGMANLGGDRVVLFGGATDQPTYTDLRDTWAFDGSSWTPLSPAESPAAGADTNAGLAALGGQVVLLANDDQTWTFGGASWNPVSGASPPTLPLDDHGRVGFSLATLHDQAVLFGGEPIGQGLSSLLALDDTWTFDGSHWAWVSVCHAPPARYLASLAFLPIPGLAVSDAGPVDAGACDADTVPDACDDVAACAGKCGKVLTAYCGLLDCGGCGPGTTCGGGGVANVCGSGACSTTSCPGCCAGGQCLPGTDKGACGTGGKACFSCGNIECTGSACGCGTGDVFGDAGQYLGGACTTSADCTFCLGVTSFCCSAGLCVGFGAPCNP